MTKRMIEDEQALKMIKESMGYSDQRICKLCDHCEWLGRGGTYENYLCIKNSFKFYVEPSGSCDFFCEEGQVKGV